MIKPRRRIGASYPRQRTIALGEAGRHRTELHVL